MMYLMLSDPSGPSPVRILPVAVLGTQAIATVIAVYGLFMTPLGWGWAAFVWGYAIVWALASDRVNLLAYRILAPRGAPLMSAHGTRSTTPQDQPARVLNPQPGLGRMGANLAGGHDEVLRMLALEGTRKPGKPGLDPVDWGDCRHVADDDAPRGASAGPEHESEVPLTGFEREGPHA